jgi:hypothetical protein
MVANHSLPVGVFSRPQPVGEREMSKGMDRKKEQRKKPLKTPAEKRAEKRAKKGQ